MTPGNVVFLAGLFGVPLALLLCAHRFRRRSHRAQRAFWGATIGHCLAVLVALPASMIPPEAWTNDDMIRGLFGLWSLFVLPLVGTVSGWGTGSAERSS